MLFQTFFFPRKTCFLCSFWFEVPFNTRREGRKETFLDWCPFSSLFSPFPPWSIPSENWSIQWKQTAGCLMFTGFRTSCAEVSEKTNLGLTDCFQPGLTRDRLCFWRTALLSAPLPGDCCVPFGSYSASLATSGWGLPHHEQQLRCPDVGPSRFSLSLVWNSDYEKTSQPSAGQQGRVG